MSHNNHQEQQQQMVNCNQVPRPAAAARMKVAAGEIVEVQGGHIVRSIGRKDRHSKVCTSKGPRDRRVRLSAHTAIQFYDVQDRLGYDRPSKAVDWLIKNAKAAIDELAELPPWHPTTTTTVAMTSTDASIDNHEMGIVSSDHHAVTVSAVSSPAMVPYNYTGSDLLPPSLASDAIADTIKYFFPMATVAASSTSPDYPADLMSCPSSQTQDLRLSLQSFQHDPILINSQSTTSVPLAFDVVWAHHSPPREVHWNPGSGGGDYFNVTSAPAQQPLHAVPLHQLLVHGTAATQRGPLQSNSPQPFRMWTDPTTAIHHAEASGFAYGNYPGFRIPARIRGDEEHGGMHGKPSSSASSPSRR